MVSTVMYTVSQKGFLTLLIVTWRGIVRF